MNRSQYFGITYPNILSKWPFDAFWEKFMCPKNMHLFDEVYAAVDTITDCDHYLVCDCCGLVVNIELIDTKYCNIKNSKIKVSRE